MKRNLVSILAIGTLAFAACGSDDGGGGGGGSAAKDQIYAELTSEGTEGLDEQCLRDKVDALSDSDARFIADNLDFEGDSAPPGASEGVLEFVGSIFDCIDFSDIDFSDVDLGDTEE